MISKTFSNLTGKVLISSPFAMEGDIFHKSLIFIIKHSEEGSIGLIFNRPINNTTTNRLFMQREESFSAPDLNLNIHMGGPVEIERAFFLHSSEYDKNILFHEEQSHISVSSNMQILKDIASGIGPRNNLFIVGYTGWTSKQLDFEIENNLWIVAEPDVKLIFAEDWENKWSITLNSAGVSSNYFVPSDASC